MINIVGAGMAGLLAGNMLRHRKPRIHEQQAMLPNNHSAVLRFRSTQVGDVLGIPFKSVTMIKGTLDWKNPIADALAYSLKTGGTMRSDRSIINGLTVAERFIAPPDLIQRMSDGCQDMVFGVDFPFLNDSGLVPVISTIPMPALMKALNYEQQPEFKYRQGVNIRATISDCDAYVSLYVPDPRSRISRVSITGNELIIEAQLREKDKELEDLIPQVFVHDACEFLGIASKHIDWETLRIRDQQYAKIVPINDDERKKFIHWATTEHNVYSLGRFAIWKPGLLLDDLVQDIRKIDRWLSSNNHYDMARSR